MSEFNQQKEILEKNVSNLDFKDKNIIYCTQFISDDDTQIDSDGPQSSWRITVLCIEKTNDDYIFHFNYSDTFHGYSYPYFKIIKNFYTFSEKLSELKDDINNILEIPTSQIGNFLRMWEEEYCYIFNSKDTDLINEMNMLIIKIKTIEETYEQRWTIEKEENDQKYKEYLQSEEYKQVLKDEEEYKHVQELEYQKKEEERLKLCIESYGEEKGREFHQHL